MLLEVSHLKKSYKNGRVRAVDGVSLRLEKNETLGLVGASGSGKSTLAKLILGVLPTDEGEISFSARGGPASGGHGASMGAIFQDPLLSLDPKMTVKDILEEPFRIQGRRDKHFLEQKVKEMLLAVELPEKFIFRHPHELSGGECQRVAIARAIGTEPELIICDEPVSSLDTLTRAQILNLLLKLQKQKGVSYLFISHDLRVVRHMSDRVLVMQDGKVLE